MRKAAAVHQGTLGQEEKGETKNCSGFVARSAWLPLASAAPGLERGLQGCTSNLMTQTDSLSRVGPHRCHPAHMLLTV